MKKGFFKSNLVLWVSFLIAAAICILFSISNISLFDMIINISMLILVLVIFIAASSALGKVEKLDQCLDKTANSVESEFKDSNELLWEKYSDSKNAIFTNKELQSQYDEYVFEIKRLSYKGNYKCDVENYINKGYIDVIGKKNILSLIPGTMTGLGILGTFIGLYLGLQNFNLNSANEIVEGIVPLMSGIKIAFTTSIMGIFFSLVFNFVYKKTFENAYDSLDEFLDAHDKYVVNNSENDFNNDLQTLIRSLPVIFSESVVNTIAPKLEELSNELLNISKSITENLEKMSDEFSVKLSNSLNPQLDKMNDTLGNLSSNIASTAATVVDESAKLFVEKMNESLGDNFNKFGAILDNTSKLQEENNKMITDVSKNVIDIDKYSKNAIERLTIYVAKLNGFQETVNDNTKEIKNSLSLAKDVSTANKEFMKKLNDFESNLTTLATDSTKTITKSSKTFTDELNKLSKTVSIVNSDLAAISKEVKNNKR